MSEWQDDFTRYSTGFAFNLTLSRDQANLLEAIGFNAWEGWTGFSGRGNFIPVVKALIRRGLVEHNPIIHAANRPANSRPKWFYRLTPAGQHVLALLRLSGVAVATDPASVEAAS